MATENMWTKNGVQPFKNLRLSQDKRKEDVTAYRREIVAMLLDEGYTVTQIHRQLSDESSQFYTENPETEKPFTATTIQNDEQKILEVTQAQQIKSARQVKVKALRRRGLTVTEIYTMMSTPGSRSYHENPHTGKPYHLLTINSDLEELRLQAYDMTQRSADSWRAKLLSELEEVKRAGWAEKKYGIVIRAIEKQIDMTGAAKPRETVNHSIRYDGTAKEELRDKISNLVADVSAAIAEDAEFTDIEIKELPDGSDVGATDDTD